MSGIPPQVSADPGTPAHEWAQSTTTAAFARPDPAPGFAGADRAQPTNPTTADLASKHAGTASGPLVPPPLFAGQQSQSWSTASTPGGDIPGAFPADTDQRGAPPLDTQAVAERRATRRRP
ncbi:hypothetical protein CERSUDRAFT_100603 [Gelatoporia subvermispora B]|uniref:Uncharacterized protein n=1 Tax=Ceriporiopsis subvermispora (strain B) TaxID=914234 RepID=M2Q383_CERS8|nr:hypothetical protein CERSUDRAFT_100603 [Gelatoporia subvermispora B]